MLSSVSTSVSGAGQLVPAAVQRIERWSSLREMAVRLRDTVTQLDDAVRAFDRRDLLSTTIGEPAVLDSSALTLRTGTATTLASTAELHAPTASSYSTANPAWLGTSTAAVTISGTYAGLVDDTLTVTVDDHGGPGEDELQLLVTDGNGDPVESLAIGADPGPWSFTLANGLQVDVDAGTLDVGDQFTLGVVAASDTDVDPTKLLGDTGVDAPGFEDGTVVTDGSLLLNGTEITVATTDTLNDVLARINDAGIGVSAAYDASTDRVTFTNDANGPADIELSGDTSGLLAALKLDGAASLLGTADDLTAPLRDVSAFAALTSGWVSIGGTNVSIDPSVDSLQAVLARITTTTSATATYDPMTHRVSVRADGGGTPTFGADQTGFLTALGLRGSTLVTGYRYGRLSVGAVEQVSDALDQVQRRLAELRSGSASSSARAAVSAHGQILADLADRDREALTRLSMFDASAVTDSSVRDKRLIDLREAADGYASVLRGSRSITDDGYLDRVRDIFHDAERALEREAEALV